MRLVHVADVHLDAPFAWAGADGGAHRRQAIRDTLRAAVDLARAEGADALSIAGDLFEHERVTEDTARFLAEAFASLAPIPVLLAPGNHDWYGPASIYHRAAWPANVTIFREDRLRPLTLAEGFTIWGGAHLAPAGTNGFLDGFAVDRGGVHVGLFHGSESAAMSAESATKFPHAPFTAAQIPQSGLHFALVGHLHTPHDGRFHAYPGNPEPLSFGESGERAALVVDVDDHGAVRTTRRPIAHTEVADLLLDVTGIGHSDALRSAVIDLVGARTGVVRLSLHGDLDPQVDLAPDTWRAAAPALDALVVRTNDLHEAYDLERLAGDATVRGQFVSDVVAEIDDPDLRRRILTTGLRALDGRDDLAVR
jgi:exonuclease SbcD